MVNRVSLAAIIGRLRARMMKINAYLNSAKAGDSLYVLLSSQKQPLLKTDIILMSVRMHRKIKITGSIKIVEDIYKTYKVCLQY